MWASDSHQCRCVSCCEERRLRYRMHVGFFKLSVGIINGIPLRMNQRTLNEATENHVAVQRLFEQRAKEAHV